MAEIPSFEEFKKQQGGGAPIPSFQDFKTQQAGQGPALPKPPVPAGLQGPPDSIGMRALKAAPQSFVNTIQNGVKEMGSLPMGSSPDTLPPGGITNPVHAAQGFLSRFSPTESFANDPIGTIAGVTKAVSGGKLAKDALPSTERAGQNFQAVEQAVGRDTPVDMSRLGPPAIRAQELVKNTGMTRPKILLKALQTIEPGSEPLTYGRSRDMASSAGELSSVEKSAMKRPMKGQVNQLAKALGDTNREAAEGAGVGDKYNDAMTEYRRAMQLRNAGNFVKKNAVKGLLGGGAAYEGYRLLNK